MRHSAGSYVPRMAVWTYAQDGYCELPLFKPDRQSARAERATVALAEKAQVVPAVWDSPTKTLERYSVVATHRSRLARLAEKLSLTRRIEMA
jgi:hypothetical protein